METARPRLFRKIIVHVQTKGAYSEIETVRRVTPALYQKILHTHPTARIWLTREKT